MTPQEFSTVAETAHNGHMLRKQIAQWIADHQLQALGTCVAFCQAQDTTADLSFQNVFAPESVSDRSQLPLFEAVARNQLDTVQMLLAAGCSLEQRDDVGRTPLYSAFLNGALTVAAWLIEQGADILAMTERNTRIFDMVLCSGDAHWVDWFLAKGLSLQHTNQAGFTCLHQVCASGNVDLVLRVQRETATSFTAPAAQGQRPMDLCKHLAVLQATTLLEPDAPLDIRFENGSTSLLDFAGRGCTDIVCHLLDRGADPKQLSATKNTLMHVAVESGNVALVRELIRRKISVEGRNKVNYRPLHWAAINGNLDMVKALVEEGKAKVNIKGNQNFIILETKTPLYLAVDGGFGEIARYLVTHGADVNALNDTSNSTAVQAAASNGDVPLLRFLLERGGSPNGVSRDKENPSDFYGFPLASSASAEVVDTLVEFGAHVNAENRCSIWTEGALRKLVGWVDKEDLRTTRGKAKLGAIAALLRHGANLRDGRGNVLPEAKCAEVMQLLRAAEKTPTPAALIPAETADAKDFGRFIRGLASAVTGGRYDKQMQEQDDEHKRLGIGQALFTKSHDCYSAEALEVFAVLLEDATAEDVNYQSLDSYYNQETALHRILDGFRWYKPNSDYAPIAQWARCVCTLLDKGADPNAKTRYHETPLHQLAKASQSVYGRGGDSDALLLQVFERFWAAGANPNLPNEQGANAIDLLKHTALVAWCKDRGAEYGKYPQALFESITFCQPEILKARLADADNRFGLNERGANLAEFWSMETTRPKEWEVALRNAQTLMRNGFQLDAIAEDGNTPLMLACSYGAILQAQWLFEQFSYDLNRQNLGGAVPLGLLLNADYPSDYGDFNEKEFKLRRDTLAVQMVHRGARLDVADNDGDTPLDLCPTVALRKQLEKAARDWAKTAL